MEDLTRLIISHERIENIKNNNLELSKEEAHYLNKVMRIKNGKKIFIANGEGSLWKAIKVKNDCLEIIKLKKPYLFQEQEIHLLGIAVVIPKSGFEDILKMCTEIGIDYIQPLFSERQVNKNLNFSRKLLRWNLIINEAVEQSERLWKPSILNGMDIIEWLKSRNNQERVSISVTREEKLYDLNQWLRKHPPEALSADRFKMVELAIKSRPYFLASDVDIVRQGHTYTIDTLRDLRVQLGLSLIHI